jgi:hypothetical protein
MSSTHADIEPIPGLPHELPQGERIVWQGRPEWKALARHTFKLRWLGAYFAVFAAQRLFVGVRSGAGLADVPGLLLLPAGLAIACLGLLAAVAWLNASAALYTITTRRVVLRIGVALPMTWNLPFKRLASANLKVREEGDGDIVLELKAPDRIAWLQLWPHSQPWRLANARPMMRTIAEPTRVASLLAEAVQAWAASEFAPVLVSSRESYARGQVASVVLLAEPKEAAVQIASEFAESAIQ